MPDTLSEHDTKPTAPRPLVRQPEVLEFLLTRRSRPAHSLRAPAPEGAELSMLLTAAARVPDHGKMEPWRFVLARGPALARLAALVETRGTALGLDPEKVAKQARAFADSPLMVAVIASPGSTERIPAIEQSYSAGAVCLSLLNAALSAGWGANWLSGFAAYDRGFLSEGLRLAPHEEVAGFIHIGTENAPPPERPRPDVTALTTWLEG
ncbi:MAG: nitroreductase [Rhodobacteraceae bacterium]|nr:nitroreductase [Paracoccaceae bacterium]